MLTEFGIQQSAPAEAYCDNLSAVHLTANPFLHKQTKHFETHYHYANERVAKGLLVVRHIPSTQQIIDIFTKPLPIKIYCDLRFKLGVGEAPTSSLQGSVNSISPPTLMKNEEVLGQQQQKPTSKSNKPMAKSVSNSPLTKDKQNTNSAIKLENIYCLLTDKDY